jgi:hypothetical protein
VLRPLGQVQGGAHHPQQLLDAHVIALSAQSHSGSSVRADSNLYGGGEHEARVQRQHRRHLSSPVGVCGHVRRVGRGSVGHSEEEHERETIDGEDFYVVIGGVTVRRVPMRTTAATLRGQ